MYFYSHIRFVAVGRWQSCWQAEKKKKRGGLSELILVKKVIIIIVQEVTEWVISADTEKATNGK